MTFVSRRVLWAALAAVIVLLLGALAGWFWVAPDLARDRIARELSARTGLRATVRGVRLGLGSVRVNRVELHGQEDAVPLELSGLSVRGRLWRIATDGAAGITSIEIERVRVRLDLSDGVPWLAQIRSSGGAASMIRGDGEPDASDGAGEPPARRPFPAVRVDHVDIAVRDDEGPLVRVEEGTVLARDGTVEGSAARVTVGRAPADSAELEGVRASAARGDGGFRLTELGVEGGVFSLGAAESGGDGPSSTASRLARAIAALRPDEAAEGPSDDDGRPGWLRRLDEEVTIELSGTSVHTHSGDERRVVLRQFTGSIRGLGQGRFRVRGDGETGPGGSVHVDVTVAPLEAHIEGTVRFDSVPLGLVVPLLPRIPWYEPERARVGGELVVESLGPTRFSVEGRVRLRDAAISSPRIAPDPVEELGGRLTGEGTWNPVERRLQIDRGTVALGQAQATVEGSLTWNPDFYAVKLEGDLPPTRCNVAIDAIPADLRGEATGFELQGKLGAHLKTAIDSRDLDAAELDVSVADGCSFVTVPSVADLRRFQSPFVHRVQEPDGEYFEMRTGPGTDAWTPLREVSPYLVHAVLAHEDAAFFRHDGFAPWAIEEALRRNLEAGRYVLGASTISMQLTKNLLLHREKTLARKVQEVLLTWWLEHAADKETILELYLNVIEYGPAVYGIEHAAEHYFGRSPRELTPAEGAFIACILPSPKRYHRQYERGTLSSGTKRRMTNLLEHMHDKGRIDSGALEHALAQVESFSFHTPGSPAPSPRELPAGASPLPYETTFDLVADSGADTKDAWTDPVDDGLWGAGLDAIPELDPDAMTPLDALDRAGLDDDAR